MHFYLQVHKKRSDKENINPSLQNALLHGSSPNRNSGPKSSVISSSQLIQNSRMMKAMVSHNSRFASGSSNQLDLHLLTGNLS